MRLGAGCDEHPALCYAARVDYEHEALNALSLSEECIKSTVGSMQLNALYAQAYATQAVALSNLALLHKGEPDE